MFSADDVSAHVSYEPHGRSDPGADPHLARVARYSAIWRDMAAIWPRYGAIRRDTARYDAILRDPRKLSSRLGVEPVQTYVGHLSSILKFRVITSAHACYRRSQAAAGSPQPWGSRDCACGLACWSTARASECGKADPCIPAAARHQDPRRGSACHAAPRVLHRRFPPAAIAPCTWAASTSSLR